MIKEIAIPYDKTTLPLFIDEKNSFSILEPKKREERSDSELDIVRSSLDHPIASLKLEELAKGKRNIVIISSDHTRPVPAHILMPEMLKRIRSTNPKAHITILVATGFHRASTYDELVEKYGKEIVDKEDIVIHSAFTSECLSVGHLPSGGNCFINKVAVDADLLISDGFIEAHLFAGFSGGRKAVLPGIASDKTIQANHSGAFISHKMSRSGSLEYNLVHKDMVYAAKAVKLAFIVNVTLDERGKIDACFSGDPIKAHEEGCRFLLERYSFPSPNADIAISSNGGYPLDQNLYQAVKGMTVAEAATVKGGIIIMVASCKDGHGGKAFYENLINSKSPANYFKEASMTPSDETKPEQWGSQILARILMEHPVYLVSTYLDEKIASALGIKLFKTINEALSEAYRVKGHDAKVAIIPSGPAVIIT